jgi:predicted RNA-binding Zn-ribbon protein involved in translation (DUF1610 family)
VVRGVNSKHRNRGIAMSIFSQAAKVILDSARKCPKCGREKIVPASRKNETVKCPACGAEIPPKR